MSMELIRVEVRKKQQQQQHQQKKRKLYNWSKLARN